MREGGGNGVKYLKRRWNRTEGRDTKILKRWGQTGSRGGCLKKGGRGAGTPLETFFFFSHRLTCMSRKNTIEISSIYWNVLLWVFFNFFTSLRRAEAITWENFVPAKQDSGYIKEGSRLSGMNRFTWNHRM